MMTSRTRSDQTFHCGSMVQGTRSHTTVSGNVTCAKFPDSFIERTLYNAVLIDYNIPVYLRIPVFLTCFAFMVLSV